MSETSMDSLQGQFLVASAQLQDPNFFKAVVLLVQHTEKGAMGLIVNRPTNAKIKEVWEQVSDTPCKNTSHLHLGGPCEGPLMALHGQPMLSQIEILSGVHYSSEPEQLQRLVAKKRSDVKFFVGYSGWGAGQLEHEMETGFWRALPAALEQIFGSPDDLWDQLTKQFVGSLLVEALKIKHVPPDPSLN